MPSVGLAGVNTSVVPGLPFRGCVYNTVSEAVLFGTGKGGVATENYRYLCKGIATTATATTTSATTVRTATETQTGVPYSLLGPGVGCARFLLPDVAGEEECFGAAAAAVSLGDRRTFAIPGMGFHGCVYNARANVVMFNGHGDGSNATTPPSFQQICRGTATTTTQTTTGTDTDTDTTTSTATPTSLTTTRAAYSMLGENMLCSNLSMLGIRTEEECFGVGATSVGVGNRTEHTFIGMPFEGCVYNAGDKVVLFGSGGLGVGPSPSLRPICKGTAMTSTVTTATTLEATETTTESVTASEPAHGYSLLALGSSCSGPTSSAVASKEECFAAAASAVGLGRKETLALTAHDSFGGCVYSPAYEYVMWSEDGPRHAGLPYLAPICRASPGGGSGGATETTTYVMV